MVRCRKMEMGDGKYGAGRRASKDHGQGGRVAE